MASSPWRRTTMYAAVCLLVAGCTGSSATAARPTSWTTAPSSAVPAVTTTTPAAQGKSTVARPTPRARTAPGISKVLVVIEENHSLTEMRSGMPYLYGLARRYGYATDHRATTHPSLPNYLAISGGSTFGVTDDETPPAHHLHGPSVFGQALSAGRTARLYAESLPAPCATANAGPFVARHAPWAYYVDERAQCRRGMVASGTPGSGRLARDIAAGALPTVGMLIPNLIHDAHDGSLGQADNWLKSWLPRIMAGPDFREGRLAIVVTADEDDYTRVNKVLTVVVAPGVQHRVVSTPLTHYSLTRLYDQVAGARPLRKAATAPSIARAFGLRLS